MYTVRPETVAKQGKGTWHENGLQLFKKQSSLQTLLFGDQKGGWGGGGGGGGGGRECGGPPLMHCCLRLSEITKHLSRESMK